MQYQGSPFPGFILSIPVLFCSDKNYVKHLISKLYIARFTTLNDHQPNTQTDDLSGFLSGHFLLYVFYLQCRLDLTTFPQLQSYFKLLPFYEWKGETALKKKYK